MSAPQANSAGPALTGAGLAVRGLRKSFGGVVAVDGVDLDVEPGTIAGLIGPNGSGKTTTLNLLSGAYRPDAGTITIRGQSLTERGPAEIVALGVSRTFQNPRVFSTITAYENMLIPLLHVRDAGEDVRRTALDLLDFVGLLEYRDTPASELSGGQQKLIEFVRALMTEPTVVLMDEPFAGVHPSVKELMRDRIRERNRRGTSFLVVSHEIPDLMRMSDTVVCMAEGRVAASGSPREVTSDPAVVEAYLGRSGTVGLDSQEGR